MRELPVGVHAAGSGRLDQQVTGALGQQRPQCRQLARLVDVDPQPPRVADSVLAAFASGPRRHPDERLLARLAVEPPASVGAGDDLLGMLEQLPEPLPVGRAGAAGEIVARVLSPVELDLAVRWPGTRGQLDQPVRLGVQQPELQRPVPRRRAAGPENVRPSASRTRHGSVTVAGVFACPACAPGA